jgi:hypothetical protein
MNKALFILSGEEQEKLLRAIETSLRVRRRHQFFLWTQGLLQAFIPHHILICALVREGKEVLVMAPGVHGPLALRERFAHPLEDFDFGALPGMAVHPSMAAALPVVFSFSRKCRARCRHATPISSSC